MEKKCTLQYSDNFTSHTYVYYLLKCPKNTENTDIPDATCFLDTVFSTEYARWIHYTCEKDGKVQHYINLATQESKTTTGENITTTATGENITQNSNNNKSQNESHESYNKTENNSTGLTLHTNKQTNNSSNSFDNTTKNITNSSHSHQGRNTTLPFFGNSTNSSINSTSSRHFDTVYKHILNNTKNETTFKYTTSNSSKEFPLIVIIIIIALSIIFLCLCGGLIYFKRKKNISRNIGKLNGKSGTSITASKKRKSTKTASVIPLDSVVLDVNNSDGEDELVETKDDDPNQKEAEETKILQKVVDDLINQAIQRAKVPAKVPAKQPAKLPDPTEASKRWKALQAVSRVVSHNRKQPIRPPRTLVTGQKIAPMKLRQRLQMVQHMKRLQHKKGMVIKEVFPNTPTEQQ